MVGDVVRRGTPLRVRVPAAPGLLLRVVTDGGDVAFEVPVTGPDFVHEFTLPPGATWVRAEIGQEDLLEERQAVCPEAVAGSYCRNRILVFAMTSALYLRGNPVRSPRPRHGAAAKRKSARRAARRAHRAR